MRVMPSSLGTWNPIITFACIWTFSFVVAACRQTSCAADNRVFQSSDRLTLGTESNRSASVRVADINGDDRPDVVIANGRHWPQQNFAFLNQGRARLSIQRRVGDDLRTSYAGECADLDGDGDLDIAIGNDMAPNQVFINDGSGRFDLGGEFGESSSVRSLTVIDIDRDGDQDILATCRGRENQIYVNDGNAKFEKGPTFGTKSDSTIDVAAADWNADGHIDLILANRDNQPNMILLNDGRARFSQHISFGKEKENTRAIAVADLDRDHSLDIVVGNIGDQNRIYFGDGQGGIREEVAFGRQDGRTYAISLGDMDNSEGLDIVVANVAQANAVFFNDGSGRAFREIKFGNETHASYSVDTGDIDGDGFLDIVVANSDAPNSVFLNRPGRATSTSGSRPRNPVERQTPANRSPQSPRKQVVSVVGSDADWPSFRGHGARGVAEGFPLATEWNADESSGELFGIQWSSEVPGLGHSSPVILGDRIFLVTAIAEAGRAPLKVGRGGQPNAAEDNGVQSWVVLCYDRKTGEERWRQTAYKGIPRATRHAKATHANTSVAVDGDNVVAFFGSEGLHCFSLEGKHRWSQDLGRINVSKYGIGWGFASSPAVHKDRIAIVCDDPDNPFVATRRLSDGEEIWRRSRAGVCERSWGTPYVHVTQERTQIVVNGWPWLISYDFDTGEELWRIRGGGDNPVPTPFSANDLIYVTNAHGAQSPIFVVHPDAVGDITPKGADGDDKSIVWSTTRGGSYLSTPVVYGDYLYLGNTNGVVRCYHAQTGEKVYEQRLGNGASIISSLVAADGKVFFPSENGSVYVVEAGPEFKLLATNPMGAPCFASPAISRGVLFIRTTDRLVAIKQP